MKYSFLLFVFCGAVYAQPYIGGAIGYSSALIPSVCSASTYESCSYKSAVYKGFAGYRWNKWAIEFGAGTLSHYSAHNVGTRPSGPYNIQQDIDTRQLYLQAMRYFALGAGFEAYGSLGVMSVKMKNHEYGFNDPSRQFVEQVNYDRRDRVFPSLGLTYRMTKSVSVRAELMQVRHVAKSLWTDEQNITAGWLGLWANF